MTDMLHSKSYNNNFDRPINKFDSNNKILSSETNNKNKYDYKVFKKIKKAKIIANISQFYNNFNTNHKTKTVYPDKSIEKKKPLVLIGLIHKFLNGYDTFSKICKNLKITKIETEDKRILSSNNSFFNLFQHWNFIKIHKSVLSYLKNTRRLYPLPIQSLVIPKILFGKDIFCLAKTGSGKTLCYLIPLIVGLNRLKNVRNIVIAPTRELVLQIGRESYYLTKHSNIRTFCFYGGSNLANSINSLFKENNIIVTTPGRLIDLILLIKKKPLWNIKKIIMDEADKILDIDFEISIKRILKNVRRDKQLLLFASCMGLKISQIINLSVFLKYPIRFNMGERSKINSNISQFFEYIEIFKKQRLLEIISYWYVKGSVIVFVNTIKSAQLVNKLLIEAGYKSKSLFGTQSQIERMITLYSFRNENNSILVSTSLASRGLDFKNVNLVINFDIPSSLEEYINRIGRTGRLNKKGTAITLINSSKDKISSDLWDYMFRYNLHLTRTMDVI
mmetsp:Transcript_12456/g.14761  ORF Transcript_12456/g.14761 Transcript_12456/m.14761 type:complete len:504 (+) Transcript_12456:408-1919(+)